MLWFTAWEQSCLWVSSHCAELPFAAFNDHLTGVRDTRIYTAIASVVPNRILMALLQPLLALLLMAGAAQAEPCMMMDEREWVLAGLPETVGTWNDRADKISLVVQPSSDRDNGHDAEYTLPASKPALVQDQARLIRNSRTAYPTAPPFCWPCAAPPTGPPLV
jgi:hypothetical protein